MESIIEYINKFKAECKERYNITPAVSYANMGKDPIIHMDEIELICNVELNKRTNGKYPHGIRTKLRKREIIEYKHAFLYFCDYYGFGCSVSSRHLGVHHATVLYAIDTVKDRIQIGDTQVIRVITEISKQIQFFIIKKEKATGVPDGKKVVHV